MRRLLLFVLLSFSCREELTCPSGQNAAEGVCRWACVDDSDCLLSEFCSEERCLPQADPETPLIRLFEAEPNTVHEGGTAAINYVVLFADSVEMMAGSRLVLPRTEELAGTVPLSPINAQVTVQLIAERSNGSSAMDDLTIRIMGANFPVIDSFTANPMIVEANASTELEWSVQGADKVWISGGGKIFEDQPLSGTLTVPIAETTEFVLEAENALGKKKTAKVIVQVIAVDPPAIQKFVAVPETVPFEIPAVVSWQNDRAAEMRLVDPGGLELMRSTGLVEANAGAWMFWPPVGPATFTMIAENSAGKVEQSTRIVRLPRSDDAVIQQFNASPIIAEASYMLRVSWQVLGQGVEVDLNVDGSVMRVNPVDMYSRMLADDTVPHEVRLVARVPGGGVAEATHIVLARTQDVLSTPTNPQRLNRQAVAGTVNLLGALQDDWFSIMVPDGGALDVGFTACGPQIGVEIVDPTTLDVIDSASTNPNGSCPTLSVPGLGTDLLIRVHAPLLATDASYVLVPEVRDPICGDSSIRGSETCDDGNRRPFDGCDAYCQMEPGYRIEMPSDPPMPAPIDAVMLRSWRQRTLDPADDEGMVILPLPNAFPLFGRDYHGAVLHTNGFVNLLPDFDVADFDANFPLSERAPNAVISLYGADLIAPNGSSETAVWYDAGSGSFSIELRNYEMKQAPGIPISGRITLFSDGRIRLDFAKAERAGPFQVGIQGAEGQPKFAYPGCDVGCSGDQLQQAGSIVLVPR